MDNRLTIHERYEAACDALKQRLVNRKIDVYAFARKERTLKGSYLYECLRTGDPGCDHILAQSDRRNRLSA